MNPQFYQAFRRALMRGQCDFEKDQFKVILVGPSYNFDAKHGLDDIFPYEIVGRGYEKGGLPLANQRLVTGDGDGDNALAEAFDADDVQWESVAGVFRGYVIYCAKGDPVCYYDCGGIRTADHTPVIVSWPEEGIFGL